MSVRKEWADAEAVDVEVVSAGVVEYDGGTNEGEALLLDLGGLVVVVEGDLESFAQVVADRVTAAGYDFPTDSRPTFAAAKIAEATQKARVALATYGDDETAPDDVAPQHALGDALRELLAALDSKEGNR